MSRLERDGRPISLPPKTFDLLFLLARTPDRLLSKHELMEALWPDSFVEEANLTQHVYTLRKALGDRADGEPYVVTVPRRGYRLNAVVREVNIEGAVTQPSRAAVDAVVPPEAVVVESERKQATVLRCSVANAADLAERLGPAAFGVAMQRLADAAVTEIDRYGGIVRHEHPDELTALFGARVVHEDDGRRAVMAALGLLEHVCRDEAKDAPDDRPFLRIGINSGAVVVNRRADSRGVEYRAVGDTMRVADLLCQLAEPSTILVSDSTRRAVEGYVELAPTPIEAGGTRAFRLLRAAAAERARPPRFVRRLTPFVGRTHELALLEALAAKAASGRGQVVTLMGEPGMGKSRLMHEFAHVLSARGDIALLEGKCVSFGSGAAYLPLIDLVRMRCGVKDVDSPEHVRAGVERTVRAAAIGGDAAAWLLHLLGVDDKRSGPSAEAIKARTFDVLRALLLKTAVQAPLVIFIEDVHWIDRTSEEFLLSLVERLGAARIMLVTSCRPGYRAPWIDRSYVTQIPLTPLPESDGSRLVNAVAGDRALLPDVSAVILARAEGNPFFLEELTRTVLEGADGAPEIPATVQGVIMARLDQLPTTAKHLLQTASVVGREVPLRVLERLQPPDRLAGRLAELCRQEFLYEHQTGDEPLYVFKHALTQDVAYDSLLARVRSDLHLQTAHALEDLYAGRVEEITATLAHHYSRTDEHEQAVIWLMRAADQTARVYANAEAIVHLDLARRRLMRLPESAARDRRAIGVALRHAHSLYFLGRFRESIDVLRPHEARLARLADDALSATYAFWLGHMYSRLGDQSRAAESAQRAIEAAARAGDTATLGKAHGVLALEGHWSGRTSDGITHGEKAIALLRTHPDERWWLGMAHFYLAMNYLLSGAFGTALSEADRADAVGKDIGDPRLQTYAAFTAGWIETLRGDSGRGLALCRRSRDQAPDRVSRAYATLLLGLAQLEDGDHDGAREVLEPTVAELRGFGFPQWQGFSAVLIGEAHRRSGRYGDAVGWVRTGVEVATRAQYWYAVAVGQRIAARLARDQGDAPRAHEHFGQAIRLFQQIGAEFEVERTRTEAAAQTGSPSPYPSTLP